MKIHNTVSDFLVNYESTEAYISGYFRKHKVHFEEYFRYHCRNPEEKLKVAVRKLDEKLNDLKLMNESMPRLIQEIAMRYEAKYDVTFSKDVHLLVGIYGSNAFTYRQIIPEIAFCLEKLSTNERHLQTIIAHEFGHALHNMISDRHGMEWSKLDWGSPYTWLLQEGCAVHFSRQVVDAKEDEYFAFKEDPEWLDFATKNWDRICEGFVQDLDRLLPEAVFREWFSINGGARFGYTRLAYYIGYRLVEALIEANGEMNSVTIWSKENYQELLHNKLNSLRNGEV
ncbi:DUF2268 domain-containing protein [Bacillus tianshenii]|uniref:DUF2268 domain-containing putative Zn-dependent protease n=1 Tax=Sutcliffiella tianshenii TaxID=1463404 RepID=UPI001CD46F46|nr:DUF2268 domain-containing putative Zn-dependent protease [Bacillus tianshenii]MCA1322461.1 DUF2268 domain-containing protein [Bacillus tianshenii]